MATVMGKCKLCLTDNVRLQLSHVLPAWSYGRLRDDRPGENPNPIHIKDGDARFDGKQVKEHMLCSPCEQKFGVYDNDVSKLACIDGAFPALQKVGPILGGDRGLQLASLGSLDAKRLGYFACSVVWRAHHATCIPDCSLGPLGETFRAYLNDQRPLPPTVGVTLSLLQNDQPSKAELGQVTSLPRSMRKRPHHTHEFALCGMYFAPDRPSADRRWWARAGVELAVRRSRVSGSLYGLARRWPLIRTVPRSKATVE